VAEPSADDVLQVSLQRANRLLDTAPGDKVLKLLNEADADLKKRLSTVAKAAGPNVRFSDAQVMAYQKQIAVVQKYVKKRLLGITDNQAKFAVSSTVRATAKEIGQLNKAFTGVAVPLRLREAGVLGGVTNSVHSSLAAQRATSVDRYGDAMIGEFRQVMRRGLVTGVSTTQMVDSLVGHGGPRGPKVSTAARVDPATGKVIRLREEAIPEGLFQRKRYWAERLVRTEVAHGQNEARLQTIERSKQTDFPDMGKKILAMMDMRTAMDSIGVHGQVRPTDGLFQDGAGRQYLRPPARPNDRETIVPWRESWDETPYSAPMPPAEVAALQQATEPPGRAKQLKVRQAQAAYKAQLDAKSKAALAKVHKAIGEKLGGKVGPAIAAQAVTETKAAQATAKAQQKAAAQKAQVAVAKAETAAAAQAQKYATAKAAAAAKAVQKVKDAQAKAKAYQKKIAAAKKAKLVQKAQHHKTYLSAMKKDPKGFLAHANTLAKADPTVFGELYSQVVKGGQPLAPKFFQNLGVMYKDNAKLIAKKMGVKVEPPKPKKPKWTKPFPKPDPDFDVSPYTFKMEGDKWNDIYKGGEKQGFILKVGDKWVADPPEYLKKKGWEKMTWLAHPSTLPQATHYSLELSKVIQATKAEAQAAAKATQLAAQKKAAAVATEEAKKAAAFAPKPTPKTVLGALKVDRKTQSAVEAARKWAKGKNIDKLRRVSGNAMVDDYIAGARDPDLTMIHKRWASTWYSSSHGAKNTVARVLAGKKMDRSALQAIAQDIGYGGPVEKIPEFVRRKYAATQAVLELRNKKAKNQREYMFLSRGINGNQGADVRAQRLKGEKTKVSLRSVSSWSKKRSTARGFAGSNGVVLRAGVHRSRIFSQFEQEQIAMKRYGDRESEYIVISLDEKEVFQNVDLETPQAPSWHETDEHNIKENWPYDEWKKEMGLQ
jgi:hypothetical protein